MDSQRIEQSLRQILDKCGEEIIHNHNRFQSAVFDLLDETHYSDERLILKHAMDSKAFWLMLESTRITADSAQKAIGQIQQESRMTKEDAELVVRCITAVRGMNTDTDFDTAHKECMGETAADPVKSDDTIKTTVANKKKIVIVAAVCMALFVVIAGVFFSGGKTKEDAELFVGDYTEKEQYSSDFTKENGESFTGILMEDGDVDSQQGATVLGSNIRRESIASITFVDTIKDAPDTAWDVSWDQDGTVMAWTKPSANNDRYDLFIGAEGGVKAKDCHCLFALYCNVETIAFNRCFDTSQVTNMERMFDNCLKLTELDLSCFDTSQVTNMEQMFFHCSWLAELDLSCFDTSQVTSMRAMFFSCLSLIELDLSSFNTSQVTNMGLMFHSCSRLIKLDLSSFNTSQVTNMEWMFHSCSRLSELDLSSFDTSQVTNMELMFFGCSSLRELDLSGFDTSQLTMTQAMLEDMFIGCGTTAEEAGLRMK